MTADPNTRATGVEASPSARTPAGRTPSSGSPEFARLPSPAALLFDLDGTLVDTVAVRIAAWRRALEEAGIHVDRDRLAGYIGSDGRWLARQMGAADGRTFSEAEARALDERHGVLFDELNVSPKPLPGATELLTALEQSGLRFGVATSSQAPQVAVSLRALGLPSPPPVINGGQVAQAKPEPDLLLAAARDLGVDPRDCWYVGDSTWDMMASARAGMAGVGVTTGAANAARLVEAGASVAVSSLTAVLEALRDRGLVPG